MNTAVTSYFYIAPEPSFSPGGNKCREAELERRERLLKEQWNVFEAQARERESFVLSSEARLAEKIEAQQDREMELQQREEDLQRRELRLKQREAALDPSIAVALASLKFNPYLE